MDFKRIKKECFWDYNIDEEKFIKMLKSDNF